MDAVSGAPQIAGAPYAICDRRSASVKPRSRACRARKARYVIRELQAVGLIDEICGREVIT